MKEIKFRAWLKEEKKMVDVDTFDCKNNAIGYIDNDDFNCHFLENNELMQFTGLYDDYGKLIYEGDIVIANIYDIPNKRTGYIWYDEEKCSFFLKNGFVIYLTWTSNCEIKVIGNIYENEDLFEKVK